MHREKQRLHAVPPPVAGRVPPHDLDAEAAVLSAILLEPSALDEVADSLAPEHFYAACNARVFEAARELAKAGTPVDIVTVAAWLRDRDRLASVGGAAYLAQLADATPAVSHVAAHAAIVVARHRQRSIIATCQRVAAEGYGDVGELQAWIDAVEKDIHDIAHSGATNTMVGVRALIGEAFTAMQEAASRGDRIVGAPTGFDRLDAKIGGLEPGRYYIVAGRPGMGKTALAVGAALGVAWPPEGQPATRGVAIFSLEMTRSEITTRMVCSEARVNLTKIRQGFLQEDDWRRLAESSNGIAALPIRIDDTPGLTPMALRARVRRLRSEWTRAGVRLALVVVDHVGLMRAELGPQSTREQEVGECSRSLKELAKDCECAVIGLVQLNRGVESRADKRPLISDLRDSGRLEEDADTVLLLYRDEYYRDDSRMHGIAEVAIGKQRSGPTGKVLLRFSPECTRFDNLAPGEYPEMDGDE